ncbi:helical backbone metal receptor [Halobaculum litoreum]|uniref:Helical backbone metal receptor n=1 Tax=Halobaculum litoreum TaxID=3031998 RepID=A0ABD5XMV8_9EURY|nr:helical backbone metal receptor [Halobaculum sp. DT92]
MVTDRVVSLAPSATVTLDALGAGGALVGATHACEVPADAGTVTTVGGWPNPDLDAVESLDPTAVLTCDALQRETAEALRDRGLPVSHAEPTRLADVFASVADVGRAVDDAAGGAALAAALRRRVDRVRAAVPDDPERRPVVYAEEWGDPPMAAGNWVPEAVAAAGGRCPFVAPGERSREVAPDAVAAAEPDHVVLHWCGRDRVPASGAFAGRGWDVDAAVHVVDDALLNQPSPRLVDGVETLARLLHGVCVGDENDGDGRYRSSE